MANLLERASVVLTPTAYNNGEALCVKPDDASGDFQFSRNSAATRVNSQGLVEDVQILSSNLVQNGSFSQLGSQEITNGNFSQQGVELGDTGIITNNNGGIITQIAGTSYNATSDGTSTASTRPRLNSFNLTAGKFYKITITPTNQSGDIKFTIRNDGSNLVGANDLSTGLEFYFLNGSNFRMFFDGRDAFNCDFEISLKEVGQDWVLFGGAEITAQGARINNTITGTNCFIKQDNSNFTAGKSFVFEYDVVATNGTTLAIEQASAVSLNTSTIGNNRKVYFQWDRVNDSLVIKRLTTGTDVTITNISVKEVGQNWTLQSEWSIGTNKAIYDNSDGGSLNQSFTWQVGKKYKITFDIGDFTTNKRFDIYSGVSYIKTGTIDNNTSYTILFDGDGGNTFRFRGLITESFSITNIKIIEITDDTNLPRINYEGFSYQDALGSELYDGNINQAINGGTWTDNGDGTFIVTGNGTPSVGVGVRDFDAEYLTIGKSYLITAISDNLTIAIYNSSFALLASGASPLYFTPTTTSTKIYLSPTDGITATYSNVSVKEYLGQEVVPDSGCGSWLWEPQSTNLVTNSSKGEYGNSPASEILATAPDGSNDAIRPVPDSNSDRYQYTIGGGSYATDSKLTYSWYRRKISTPVNDTYIGDLYPNVLVNCTQVGSTTQVQSGINNFDRFEAIFNITDGALSTIVRMYFGPVIGVGNSSVAYWGHQLEAQTYSTSLIPTDGTSVTRNQDVCTNGGSAASINSTEGVLYFEGSVLENTSSFEVISLSDGGASNILGFVYRNIANQFTAVLKSGGSTSLSKTITLADATATIKAAISYKLNDFKFYVNGVLIIADTTGNTPIGLNTLQFADGNGTSNKFFGKTKAVAVWKEALTDTELQELTTI